VSKQSAEEFGMERFKVNEVEIGEHHQVNIPNRFAALALDDVKGHKEGL